MSFTKRFCQVMLCSILLLIVYILATVSTTAQDGKNSLGHIICDSITIRPDGYIKVLSSKGQAHVLIEPNRIDILDSNGQVNFMVAGESMENHSLSLLLMNQYVHGKKSTVTVAPFGIVASDHIGPKLQMGISNGTPSIHLSDDAGAIANRAKLAIEVGSDGPSLRIYNRKSVLGVSLGIEPITGGGAISTYLNGITVGPKP